MLHPCAKGAYIPFFKGDHGSVCVLDSTHPVTPAVGGRDTSLLEGNSTSPNPQSTPADATRNPPGALLWVGRKGGAAERSDELDDSRPQKDLDSDRDNNLLVDDSVADDPRKETYECRNCRAPIPGIVRGRRSASTWNSVEGAVNEESR